MTGLTYFAAMAVLMAALIFGQSSTPSSDAGNSSHSSTQSQNGSAGTSADQNTHRDTHHGAKPRSQENVPNTTVNDQQSSTTSRTGVAGQNNTRPSTSTMGTTGKTPATSDQAPPKNNGATTPQSGTPTDQQPNSPSSPSSPPPQATMYMSPAARAAATHVPDPGTCMNPVAFDNGQNTGAPPRPGPNCE
jgi:hypothetical protein